MKKREQIIEQLKKSLNHERFRHSLGVEKTAVALAEKYKVLKNKASLAALLHDCARKYNSKELLAQARKHKLEIDPIRKFEPKLFHAELSAIIAKKDFKIKDKAVLSAIEKHTAGSANMNALEKIIFLADHIEEGRNFFGVNRLRDLALENLDRAVLESTSIMLQYLLKKEAPIYYKSIETRNYYLLKLKA